MYPLDVFNLFPPFPRNNYVFVAMDFDERFEERWEEVIKPAVRNFPVDGSVNEKQLEPYRVDMSKASESIITEIIYSISNCFLFFADVTTIGRLKKKPIRNSNVMYEIGLAHAVRLPAEVILFRSDNDPIAFDINSVRVNRYDPDKKKDVARDLVTEALKSAKKELELQRLFSVQKAVNSLTIDSRECLHKFSTQNMSDTELIERNNSIRQLIDLGIIKASYSDLDPSNRSWNAFGYGLQTAEGKYQFCYEFTNFGLAVKDSVIKCNLQSNLHRLMIR